MKAANNCVDAQVGNPPEPESIREWLVAKLPEGRCQFDCQDMRLCLSRWIVCLIETRPRLCCDGTNWRCSLWSAASGERAAQQLNKRNHRQSKSKVRYVAKAYTAHTYTHTTLYWSMHVHICSGLWVGRVAGLGGFRLMEMLLMIMPNASMPIVVVGPGCRRRGVSGAGADAGVGAGASRILCILGRAL